MSLWGFDHFNFFLTSFNQHHSHNKIFKHPLPTTQRQTKSQKGMEMELLLKVMKKIEQRKERDQH